MTAMDTEKLTAFFKWCSIINGVLLVLAILGIVLGPEFGHTLQSRMFQVAPGNLSVALYMFLGMFKIFWLVFNVVPYVALRIVAGSAASDTALHAPA